MSPQPQPSDQQPAAFVPVTFRLPKAGEKDPHFGLARSFYYQSEAEGRLRLLRLRKRGFARGLTLVPFQAIIDLLQEENPGLLGHLERPQAAPPKEA